ncbi:MAG: alanine racemase [Glaciecola sp.]|jgi:alanine racemase
MPRSTRALISLDALRHNYQLACSHAGSAEVIAIIKADAYGHGMVPVARALQGLAPVFAVAFLDEALILREHGITEPILILEGPMDQAEIATAQAHNCWLMLHTPQHLTWLAEVDIQQPNQVWFKIDTGMHRLGLSETEFKAFWQRQSIAIQQTLSTNAILATHFAKADNDPAYTQEQYQKFDRLQALTSMRTSCSNSPALFSHAVEQEHFVRLGIALYGGTPDAEVAHPLRDQLQPVMTLEAQVLALRDIRTGEGVGYGQIWQATQDTTLATIAIGYADGIPRAAANVMDVVVAGKRCPVVGRVSMDMISVDVTAVKEQVNTGDMVEIWGAQQAVEEVAAAVDTIHYELLTRLSLRVPRQYA